MERTEQVVKAVFSAMNGVVVGVARIAGNITKAMVSGPELGQMGRLGASEIAEALKAFPNSISGGNSPAQPVTQHDLAGRASFNELYGKPVFNHEPKQERTQQHDNSHEQHRSRGRD